MNRPSSFLILLIFPIEVEASLSIDIPDCCQHLRSGDDVTQTIEITVSAGIQQAGLRWQAIASSVVVSEGTSQLASTSAGSLASEIHLRVPPVERKCELNLLIQATNTQGETAFRGFRYWIYPHPWGSSMLFLESKRLGVFDPHRKTQTSLRRGPGQVDPLLLVDSIIEYDGDLLVIGEGALDRRETRRRFCDLRRESALSLPMLILRQKSGAFPEGDRASRGRSFIPEIAAEGHPVFSELSVEDLGGWRKGGLFGIDPAQRPQCGNFRRLLAEFSKQGVSQPVMLQESFTEAGVLILECQLPVVERIEDEPTCSILLANLLRHLVEYTAPTWESDLAILGEPSNVALRNLTERLLAKGKEWDPGAGNPLAGDWSAHTLLAAGDHDSVEKILKDAPDFFQEESMRIERGERLILVDVREDVLDLLEPILGTDIHVIETASIEFRIPYPNDPLLWGLAYREWKELFTPMKGREAVYPPAISVGAPDGKPVACIEPGRLTRLKKGPGEILLLQAPLITERVDDLVAALVQLLTNCGVRLPDTKGEMDS